MITISFGQEPAPEEIFLTIPDPPRDYSKLETDIDIFYYNLKSEFKSKFYPTNTYIFNPRAEIACAEFNNGKLGFVDKRGKTIIEPIYDLYQPRNTYFLEGGKCIVRKDEKFGVINYLNQIIVPFDYESIKLEVNGYVVKKNNKYGISSHSGKIILESIYDKIEVTLAQYTIAQKDKNWVVADNKGKILVNEDFDEIQKTRLNNFYKVKKNGKYGLLSLEQGMVVPAEYTLINDSYDFEGFVIEKEQKKNMIGRSGKKLLPQDYEYVSYHEIQKNWIVGDFKNKGLLDSTMKEIIPFKFYEINPICYDSYCKEFSNYYIVTHNDGSNLNRGVFNTTEKKFEINIEYNTIEWIKDRIFVVQKNNKKGVIRDGKLIVPIEYLSIWQNSEKNGLICINESQNKNFDFEKNDFSNNDFEKIEKLGEYGRKLLGYTIMKDKKMGFINENGVVIVPPQYDLVKSLTSNGNCLLVIQNKKMGLMNLSGELIEPIQNDDIEFVYNKLKIKKDSKWKLALWEDIFYNSKIVKIVSTDYLYNEIKIANDGIGILLDNKKYVRIKNELVEVP